MNLESTVLIQELKRSANSPMARTAGIDCEVYCGRWFVVGRMLSDRVSFSTLRRMSQTEAEARVAATIDSLHVECACS
jgi:hypothetical protein